MTPAELHRRAMELFDLACDLPTTEQDSLLAESCAEQPELRRKVLGMLRRDATENVVADAADAGGAAEQLAIAVAQTDDEDDAPPKAIGAYRIIGEIGRGGMGVIYEAEQESPNRRVALKVLRPGTLSREILRRFQREANVLGRLQHPGIAQVYEAGMGDVPGGRRPYLAMELIDGLPLDRHAETHHLTHAQRLELLARVCDAVQHAHQRGFIHRDLKPPNVLVIAQAGSAAKHADKTASAKRTVTRIDTIGLPKVLDFGIARVTDADLQTVTVQTEVGQVVGTLAYMSPEQISGHSSDLDTRCDVYALGVMLYELLAGHRPHNITGLPLPEAARVIREQEPSPLGSVDRSFRGDVETIVAKAMEADRERRYKSAADFAADIRRHLAFEPIEARAASTFYQIRKFTKRHRALVGGVAATFVALLAGLVGTGHYLIEAQAATARLESVVHYQSAMLKNIDVQSMGLDIVDDMRREARAAIGADAKDSADQLSILEQALSRINATTIASRALDTSIMSGAVSALDDEFADQPSLQADLRSNLVDIYGNIGLYEQALDQAQQEWAARRRLDGDEAASTLAVKQKVCELQLKSGAYEDAEHTARSLLEVRRRVLGDDHVDTLVTRRLLGRALLKLTRPKEALEQLRESLAGLERTVGPKHPAALSTRAELGAYYLQQRKLDQAREAYEFVLGEYKTTLGPDHEETLSILQNLAQTNFVDRQFESALELSRQLCDLLSAKKGADHPDTLAARMTLANTLTELHRYDEAEPIVTETLARSRAVLGTDHPFTMEALSAALRLSLKMGRWDAAEEYGKEALEIAERTLGPDNLGTLDASNDLTYVYVKSGKHDLAIAQGRRALAGYQRVLGPSHRRTLVMQQVLAKAYMSAGRLEDAASELDPLIRACREDFPGTSTYAGSLGLGVTTLVNLNRGAEAESLALELLKWCDEKKCKDGVRGRVYLWIARAQLAQGHDSDAEDSVARSIDLLKDGVSKDHWSLQLAQLLRSVVALKKGEAPATDEITARFRSFEESAQNMAIENRNTILPEVRRILAENGITIAESAAQTKQGRGDSPKVPRPPANGSR